MKKKINALILALKKYLCEIKLERKSLSYEDDPEGIYSIVLAERIDRIETEIRFLKKLLL